MKSKQFQAIAVLSVESDRVRFTVVSSSAKILSLFAVDCRAKGSHMDTKTGSSESVGERNCHGIVRVRQVAAERAEMAAGRSKVVRML